MEGRKKKKPTKKEAQDLIVETFKNNIKNAHINGIVQGGEIIATIVLEDINNGKSLEEIKNFCALLLHNKETMKNMIKDKK